MRNILVIADIEGSSGCFGYEDSRFLTRGWARACRAMSLDVDAVARALFEAGVERVRVRDFHRTGYNLLPELIDRRAEVIHGYRTGPVLGLGDPGGARGVMYLGLHAPSGSDGFLAHTLTSRISRLEVNGRLLSEAELFSAILAPWGIRPLFFSGCPRACAQAREVIKGLDVFEIDKPGNPGEFDAPGWRERLAGAAVLALGNDRTVPHDPAGPFSAVATMRDGPEIASRIARCWGLRQQGARLFLEAPNLADLFSDLTRMAYLNRVTGLMPGVSLGAYGLIGRLGLTWVRRSQTSDPHRN